MLTRAVAVTRYTKGEEVLYRPIVDTWYVFHPDGSSCVGNSHSSVLLDPWSWEFLEIDYAQKQTWRCAHRYIYNYSHFGGAMRENMEVYSNTEHLLDVAEGTIFAYGLKELLIYSGMKYNRLADIFVEYFKRKKYPAYEWLLKMGLHNIVVEKLDKRRNIVQFINYRGKTLKSIFRQSLTKAQKSEMLTHGCYVGENTLKEWLLDSDGFFTLGETAELVRCTRASFLSDVKEFMPMKRAAPFIKKTMQTDGKSRLLIDWLDYLGECRTLGYDLTDKSVAFPKDIRAAHQRTLELVKCRNAEEKAQAFFTHAKSVKKKYTFARGEYKIITPTKPDDLIEEGKKLHHCVATYIDRFAAGNTDIVFIRAKSNPKEPLGTMEIQNGRIIQARGIHNHDLPEEVKEFIKAFEKAKLKGAA